MRHSYCCSVNDTNDTDDEDGDGTLFGTRITIDVGGMDGAMILDCSRFFVEEGEPRIQACFSSLPVIAMEFSSSSSTFSSVFKYCP